LRPRRALLALPLLAMPALVRAGGRVPFFHDWVGRTARLRGEGGAARLLLTGDGHGLISVKFLVFCRPLPVLSWAIDESGTQLAYTRESAVFPGRIITGQARIEPDGEVLRWIEAQSHLAEFEGFAEPEAATRCD